MPNYSAQESWLPPRNANLFWERFANRYWQRRPVSLRDASSMPMPQPTSTQLFQMTVACVEALRNGVSSPTPIVRFFVDGQFRPLDAHIRRLLPRRSDDSFEGYHRRITGGSEDAQYALMIGDLHAWDRRFFGELCRGMEGLFRQFGIPAWMVDTQLLVGNYSTTPFGVHVDPSTVFHFPVIGRKTLRLWRGDYVERTADLKKAHQYERHLGASTLIETGPGGMLYWPSDRWHIAEAQGGLSVTWGIGYFFGAGPERLLREHLDAAIIENAHLAYPWSNGGRAFSIPRSVRAMADAVKKIASDRAIEDECRTRWTIHVSSYAFRSLPAPLPRGRLPSEVQALSGHPLASFRLQNGKRRVVSVGRYRDFFDSDALRAALRALAAGRRQRVVRLVERADTKQARRNIQALVGFGLEQGSLERTQRTMDDAKA